MAVAISNTGGDIAGVAASGNVASYSSVSIGTAAEDRIVVVCVGTELASSVPTACTINSGGGAVAMTAAEAATQGAVNSHIFYLEVPTGTTATIAVTFGATNPTGSQNKIAVFRVVGAKPTPSDTGFVADTDADPISSGALTVPTSGGGIAICSDATAGTARTWTGFAEDLDVNAGAFQFSTGTTTTAGTPTITVSGGNNEDGALSWIIFGLPLSQAAFRFYGYGTESGSNARAAQDTNINMDGNTFDLVQIRFRIQENAGISGASTDDYNIQYSKNSGAYANHVSGGDGSGASTFSGAAGLTDQAATTNRLTGGTGSFVAGKQSDNPPLEDLNITASNFTELLFANMCAPDQINNGDTFDWRILVNSATMTYSVTPRITIQQSRFTQDAFRFYEDGTESGSVAIAAQDTNITRNTSTDPHLQVRFRLQENNNFMSTPGLSDNHQLFVSKNGGAYVIATDNDWTFFNSTNIVNAEVTTNRLGAGVQGTFYAGAIFDDQVQTFNTITYQGNNYTEVAFSLDGTNAVAGSIYDFKLVNNSKPYILETWNQIARITVTGVPKSYVFYPSYFRPFIVR